MATRFFPNHKANLITSRFGIRVHPVDGVKKTHNGIDMTATNDGKTGQTDYITAHTGGTVEKVGYDTSAGNFINIRVDPETIMVYYHLKNRSNLKKGDEVKKGQTIGYMGRTGKATGPHLHFGIKKNGKWIDPEPYLDKDWPGSNKMVSVEVPVLQRGAKGESVRSMQQLLIAKGFGCGASGADGSFGAATSVALKLYQKANGLAVDGSCGPATWASLLGV